MPSTCGPVNPAIATTSPRFWFKPGCPRRRGSNSARCTIKPVAYYDLGFLLNKAGNEGRGVAGIHNGLAAESQHVVGPDVGGATFPDGQRQPSRVDGHDPGVGAGGRCRPLVPADGTSAGAAGPRAPSMQPAVCAATGPFAAPIKRRSTRRPCRFPARRPLQCRIQLCRRWQSQDLPQAPLPPAAPSTRRSMPGRSTCAAQVSGPPPAPAPNPAQAQFPPQAQDPSPPSSPQVLHPPQIQYSFVPQNPPQVAGPQVVGPPQSQRCRPNNKSRAVAVLA